MALFSDNERHWRRFEPYECFLVTHDVVMQSVQSFYTNKSVHHEQTATPLTMTF